MKVFLKKYQKYIKFIIAVFLFFFGSLIQYIPIYFFKLDINNINIITKNYLNIFSNAVVFTILCIMYMKDIVKGIKKLIDEKGKSLEKGFWYWFVGVVIMIISNKLIGLFNSAPANEESIHLFLKESPLLTIISISILGPIIEELVFRKSFKDVFKNKIVYFFASGIIFGALHIVMNPVNSLLDYLYLIPYCTMGLSFAYMYYKTDNITTSMIMHIFHNSLNVISTLILGGFIIC